MNVADAAVAYAERLGWPVLPLVPGDKAPLLTHGFRDASLDPETIRGWWQRWPDANVGIAIPPDLAVVDIDDLSALHAVKHGIGSLPTTCTQVTPRPGLHLIYRADGRRMRNAPIMHKVELRAGGRGYLAVWPSRRPRGEYRWESPPTEIAEAPSWIYELATSHRPDWDEVAATERVEEGERNATLASVAGLVFRYLPPRLAADLARCWAAIHTPGLRESEVDRTIASIARCEMRRGER